MAEIKFIESARELGIEITEAEAGTIADEMSIMLANFETTAGVFKLKLTNLIDNLKKNKMTDEQVINVLLDDLENNGNIFGGLKRQLIGDAQGMIARTSQKLDAEILQRETGDKRLTWIAVLVNTCEDCLPRHGITKTYKEWQELGLPATGWSVCKSNCQCQLFPASVAESKEELQAPLKRTKGKITQIAREKKKAGEIKSVNKYVNRKLGRVFNTKEPLRKDFRKFLPGFKR